MTRRCITLAVLACALAGCKDSLGIGGSTAVYRVRAHTHALHTDPPPTWTEDHDYDGTLLLAQAERKLRVVLTLRECQTATACSTRTFRSDERFTQYEGGTRFYTEVVSDDGQSPYGFDIGGDVRPEGFTGRLDEIGGRYAPLGSFVATPR